MDSKSIRRPRVIAHRGASGYAPETTLEAYRLALEMGVDGVEMDVHRLRDGVIVAIHDPDVKRTTNGKGKISDLTAAELKAMDAGSWFNRAFPKKSRPEYVGLKVPTLQEIIDLVKESRSRAGLYIEIKDPERYPDIESSLLSLLCSNQLRERACFLSFSSQSVRTIKTLDRSSRTALLVSRLIRDPVQEALHAFADELAIRHDLATAAIVKGAHQNGLSLSVWTVDRPSDLEHMIRLGADAIITNYPDRLYRLLGRDPKAASLPQ